MKTLDAAAIRTVMRHVRTVMDAHRDRMVALDQAIGDGDLGLTMTRGFAAADDYAAASTETLPGKLLMQIGMTIGKAAPSTMGTLMATGFMRGGKAVGDATAMDTDVAAAFLRAFVAGIIERGKTKPGNKTVVDALDPAAAALEHAAARGDDVATAFQAAAVAAEAGRDAARQMTSQHGKAAVFREQTIGVEDPGAYVGALLVRAIAEAIETA